MVTLFAVVSIAGVAAPLLEATVDPLLKATRDLRLVALDIKLAPRVAQFRTLMRMAAEHIRAVAGKRVAWVVFPWTVRFILRVVELVTVSCVVELAMTLPMAIYFHRITVFALPVNLFILPLLTVLIPIALVTLMCLAAWPVIAAVAAAGVAIVLHAGVWLVQSFGSLEYGDLGSHLRSFGSQLPFTHCSVQRFCWLTGARCARARCGDGRHGRA